MNPKLDLGLKELFDSLESLPEMDQPSGTAEHTDQLPKGTALAGLRQAVAEKSDSDCIIEHEKKQDMELEWILYPYDVLFKKN